MPEKITDYLETAGDQIRWKRARPVLTAELRTHLLEQRDACLDQGMDQEAAEAEALRQMGDPVDVGRELDRVHRPRPQWGLLLLIGLLALTGGILRVALTAGTRDAVGLPQTVLAVALGFGCLLGGYFLDYTFLGRHPRAVYLGALALGLLSLWLSPHVNHASYYTRYVVLLYPCVYAVVVYALRGKGWKGLLLAVLGAVPLAVIALLAPYALGLLVLLAVGFFLLLLAVRKGWFGVSRTAGTLALLSVLLLMIGAVLYQYFFQGVYHSRVLLLLHPELDPLGNGYMALSIRGALEGARWLGEGVLGGNLEGASMPCWMLVPESRGDALLTMLIHYVGWLPFLALTLALAGLLVWVLVKCARQKNALGRLASLAVALTLGLQALASLCLNLGYVFTSASFPLITGNLHTMLDLGLLGLALSVFRQEHLPVPAPACRPEAPRRPLISWRDGDLVIALGRKS